MSRCILLLILMLLCGGVKAQALFLRQDARFIYKLTVESSSEYDCSVKSIRIISKEDKHEAIIIPPEGNYIRCEDDSNDKQCFAIEDMNFDGYNDLRLLSGGTGTGHNLTYYYWVYDPGQKVFVSDSTFDALTEPEFNAGSKTIISYYSNGNAGSGSSTYELYKGYLRLTSEYRSDYNEYTGNYLIGQSEYIYIKGKQVKSFSEDETFDEKRKMLITTTRRRVNGQLKIVKIIKTPAEKGND